VIKYDFIVKKGANINLIQLHYNNTNGIDIINDDLVIKTSVGNVIENKPIAYQLIKGKKKFINCNYILLNKTTIGFNCPQGFDRKYDLIIDPTIIVCSYSGSSTYVESYTSTYDQNGNIYNLGATGDAGYPTTIGAFQTLLAAQGYNFVLSVYNNNGASKFYSTYLGGDSLDTPINMVIKKNEINIFGLSCSRNFPVTSNAYDVSNNGKYDFVISKLNLSGTNLLASTYVGGLKDEGNPYFHYNGLYNTTSVGEMVCDSTGNVFIFSNTESPNFPITLGAISTSIKGPSDACVFKLNQTLQNLVWSTYLGGTSRENGGALRLDSHGDIYCYSCTNSIDFPVTLGCYQAMKLPPALASDFCITHINSTGTIILASTYLGTSTSDLSSLMDLDKNDNVYIVGNIYNSISSFTATIGVYSNPNGQNVICKLNSSLSTVYFQSKFGSIPAGTSYDPYFRFSAFKVDSCQKIYLAGYGSNSYPITPNAFMPYGGGLTDMYMAVFNPNFSSLAFGSYYGGSSKDKFGGGEHNLGINYFDDKGVLYMAIGTSGQLPVTSGVYSNSFIPNDTLALNDAFLKVDFQTFVNASSSYGANITGCHPFNAQFNSFANTGVISWDFGDGSHSNQSSISHLYPNLGTYDIVLVVTDSTTCNRVDSIKSTLYVIEPVNLNLGEDKFICENSSITLSSNINTITYLWNTGETTPSIIVNQPGNYSLILNNGGCSSTDDINIIYSESNLRKDFPNVITPNNDKINDAIDFSIYNLETIEFIVFDRWGREKYKTSDIFSKWTPNNFEDGTYFYVLNYIPKCSQDLKKLQGFISVFK
jgi:hypothetical protein